MLGRRTKVVEETKVPPQQLEWRETHRGWLLFNPEIDRLNRNALERELDTDQRDVLVQLNKELADARKYYRKSRWYRARRGQTSQQSEELIRKKLLDRGFIVPPHPEQALGDVEPQPAEEPDIGFETEAELDREFELESPIQTREISYDPTFFSGYGMREEQGAAYQQHVAAGNIEHQPHLVPANLYDITSEEEQIGRQLRRETAGVQERSASVASSSGSGPDPINLPNMGDDDDVPEMPLNPPSPQFGRPQRLPQDPPREPPQEPAQGPAWRQAVIDAARQTIASVAQPLLVSAAASAGGAAVSGLFGRGGEEPVAAPVQQPVRGNAEPVRQQQQPANIADMARAGADLVANNPQAVNAILGTVVGSDRVKRAARATLGMIGGAVRSSATTVSDVANRAATVAGGDINSQPAFSSRSQGMQPINIYNIVGGSTATIGQDSFGASTDSFPELKLAYAAYNAKARNLSRGTKQLVQHEARSQAKLARKVASDERKLAMTAAKETAAELRKSKEARKKRVVKIAGSLAGSLNSYLAGSTFQRSQNFDLATATLKDLGVF